MKLFICRWPNGSVSLVHCKSAGEAFELLDEVGDPEGQTLVQARESMAIHLDINDHGNFFVEGFNEQFEFDFMNDFYPTVAHAINEGESDDEGAMKLAVQHERERLGPKKDGHEHH